MKTSLFILALITIIDLVVIGLFFTSSDKIATELLIGVLIFALLFTLRILSNQIIITNGNNKKN